MVNAITFLYVFKLNSYLSFLYNKNNVLKTLIKSVIAFPSFLSNRVNQLYISKILVGKLNSQHLLPSLPTFTIRLTL